MFRKLLQLSLVLGIFAVPVAHAATVVWVPTDGDVNFVAATVTDPANDKFAMFDVADFDSLMSSPLYLAITGDVVPIVGPVGGNYTATNLNMDSITLYDDNEFVLALYDGSSWTEPIHWASIGGSSTMYNVTFADGSIYQIDVSPIVPSAGIPEPLSVLLVGSAVGGLVVIRRRSQG